MDVRLTLTKDCFVLQKPNVDRQRWRWFWRGEGDECFSGKENGRDCFDGYDWNLRVEGKDSRGKNGKEEKIAFEKWKLNFLRFHQFSQCTRDFLFDTCTWQHNMQGVSSASLTDLLDGGTILMDVREIQG